MFKIKVEKNCEIFHIVFLQHRVEIRGLETKNHMKPDKEVLAEHHCSYALVKYMLGAKPPDVDMRFSKSLRVLFLDVCILGFNWFKNVIFV